MTQDELTHIRAELMQLALEYLGFFNVEDMKQVLYDVDAAMERIQKVAKTKKKEGK